MFPDNDTGPGNGSRSRCGRVVSDGVFVHTNGVESLWAILKRACMGTHHWMSPKHLQRYVNELCGRHNIRDMDTIDQMKRGRGRDGREVVAVPEAGGWPASQRTADTTRPRDAGGSDLRVPVVPKSGDFRRKEGLTSGMGIV